MLSCLPFSCFAKWSWAANSRSVWNLIWSRLPDVTPDSLGNAIVATKRNPDCVSVSQSKNWNLGDRHACVRVCACGLIMSGSHYVGRVTFLPCQFHHFEVNGEKIVQRQEGMLSVRMNSEQMCTILYRKPIGGQVLTNRIQFFFWPINDGKFDNSGLHKKTDLFANMLFFGQLFLQRSLCTKEIFNHPWKLHQKSLKNDQLAQWFSSDLVSLSIEPLFPSLEKRCLKFRWFPWQVGTLSLQAESTRTR